MMPTLVIDLVLLQKIISEEKINSKKRLNVRQPSKRKKKKINLKNWLTRMDLFQGCDTKRNAKDYLRLTFIFILII